MGSAAHKRKKKDESFSINKKRGAADTGKLKEVKAMPS